jgi:hypothetical protein
MSSETIPYHTSTSPETLSLGAKPINHNIIYPSQYLLAVVIRVQWGWEFSLWVSEDLCDSSEIFLIIVLNWLNWKKINRW